MLYRMGSSGPAEYCVQKDPKRGQHKTSTKQRNRQRPAETSIKPAQNSETGRDQERPAQNQHETAKPTETSSDLHKTSTKQRNRQRPAENSAKPAQNSETGRDQQRPAKKHARTHTHPHCATGAARPAETSPKPHCVVQHEKSYRRPHPNHAMQFRRSYGGASIDIRLEGRVTWMPPHRLAAPTPRFKDLGFSDLGVGWWRGKSPDLGSRILAFGGWVVDPPLLLTPRPQHPPLEAR